MKSLSALCVFFVALVLAVPAQAHHYGSYGSFRYLLPFQTQLSVYAYPYVPPAILAPLQAPQAYTAPCPQTQSYVAPPAAPVLAPAYTVPTYPTPLVSGYVGAGFYGQRYVRQRDFVRPIVRHRR